MMTSKKSAHKIQKKQINVQLSWKQWNRPLENVPNAKLKIIKEETGQASSHNVVI